MAASTLYHTADPSEGISVDFDRIKSAVFRANGNFLLGLKNGYACPDTIGDVSDAVETASFRRAIFRFHPATL
jgi:hypothetical protein